MLEDRSLEGWSPVVGRDATLEEIVDLAFDYRGDVTVVRRDGAELTGYLYNRNRDVPEARGLARHLGLARVDTAPWPHYRGGALEVVGVGLGAGHLAERLDHQPK